MFAPMSRSRMQGINPARTAAVQGADAPSESPQKDEAVYAQGWMDAVRAVRSAMRAAGSWKVDEYFLGWIDAATLQPIDPIRLVPSKAPYARGYAAGAKAYEIAHHGGYDAE